MFIRDKLIITFLAIASIPLLFVSVLTFHNYKNSLEANHLSQLQNIAAFKAERIEDYFAGLKADIEIAQGFYNIKKNLPVLSRLANEPKNPEFLAAQKVLNDQLQQMQSVSGLSDIMLINSEGMVVYASKPGHYYKYLSKGYDAEQKAFREGRDRVYFSDVYFDKEEDNRLEILLTAPAADFNGAFIGVIAFEVDMTPVHKLIQDATGLGKTGEVLVGKKSGNEVVYLNSLKHEPNVVMKRINIGEEAGGPIQEAVQGRNGAGQLTDYRGKKVIAAWRYIPSLDWGMVAKIDAKEAFADVTNLRNLIAIILVMIIVLSGVMAFSIAHSISEPIKRLSEGAAIIGSGNLDYKVGTNSKDEIGQLSRSFDKMTVDLKRTTASRDELSVEVRERKEAEDEVRKAATRFEILSSIASQLLESKNPQQIVNSLCSRVMEYLDCHIFVNYLVDEQAHRLHINATGGIPEKMARDIEWLEFGQAICGRVAQEGKRIVAENIQESCDARADLVRSVGIKAYACHPILVQGKVIGTLSFGTRSRKSFSDDDLATMKTVTDQVATAMERTRAEEVVRKSREDLNRAQAVAHTGSWRMDIQRNELTWSEEAHRIFCIPAGTAMTYESFLDCVHPEDRKTVNMKWREALRGKDYDIEYRIVVDGNIKWVKAKAELEFDKDGTLLGGFGTVMDITKLKEAETILLNEKNFTDTMIDSLPGVFYLFNEQGKFLRWNKNFERVVGYTAREMSNANPVELFADDDKSLIAERIQEVFVKGKSTAEARLISKSGVTTAYFLTGNRLVFEQTPCLVGMGIDISVRKEMEEALREAKEGLEHTEPPAADRPEPGGELPSSESLIQDLEDFLKKQRPPGEA